MRKYFNLTVLFVAVAALVVGSIWDYEIAKATYIGEMPRENIFGAIFSYIGIIPTFVGWSFLGASIFCLAKKQIGDTKKRRWPIALAILLFVLSFFYFCNTLYLVNANAFRMHFALAYGVGIATLGGAAFFLPLLARKLAPSCTPLPPCVPPFSCRFCAESY